MDYNNSKMIALKLLSNFGNTKKCTLIKKEDNTVKTYKGVGVKLDYSSETIGSNDNIIKAGDAKLLCMFDTAPTEMTDLIEFNGIRFNIINAGELSPNGELDILYTLQVRKA